MRTLVVATRNPDKLAELRAVLEGLAVEPVSAASLGVPPVDETGATFADNALLKAAAAFVHSGELALADDSGLCVDALDGAPGVKSARFAGGKGYPSNNRRLLELLAGVPELERTATFVCSLALLVPSALAARVDARPTEREGVPQGATLFEIAARVRGRILSGPRGEGGFGFDPLFFYPPLGQTFGELPTATKRRVNHRGQALAALRPLLEACARVA